MALPVRPSAAGKRKPEECADFVEQQRRALRSRPSRSWDIRSLKNVDLVECFVRATGLGVEDADLCVVHREGARAIDGEVMEGWFQTWFPDVGNDLASDSIQEATGEATEPFFHLTMLETDQLIAHRVSALIDEVARVLPVEGVPEIIAGYTQPMYEPQGERQSGPSRPSEQPLDTGRPRVPS
jgi:hypothetical protein